MNKFPKNARVCFIGDSITRANDYIAHIAAYYQEHFPEDNINFYNCGISGATSEEVLKVFAFDTASYNPTHAVIMVGVNDSGRDRLAAGRSIFHYEKLKSNLEKYMVNLDSLCSKLLAMKVEITLCTAVPIDEYSDFQTPVLRGSFALMMAYAEQVRNYAREKGFGLCDYFAYFTQVLQSGTVLYQEDRIHPNELGHYHLAKCFLAFQGLKIGEYGPLPKYLEEWRRKVEAYRNIWTIEYQWLGDHTLSAEEGAAKLEERARAEENPELLELAKEYLAAKKEQSRIKEDMVYAMEVEIKQLG